MKALIESIQTKLVKIPTLKYADEDWGQLDYYSPNFPVQWPCALIDISNISFSDISYNRKKKPIQRQQASGLVKITVANLKLTNTSGRSPQTQKNNAWSIWELIQNIHKHLHGFIPVENAGRLMRRTTERTLRDDGVQEYAIYYEFELSDV